MNCVKSIVKIEDTIKKSRFIGILIPCQSENEVLQQLDLYQQEYVNASHLAFSYRVKSSLGIITRFHDAGEPNGTAGKPIFQHLEGKDLVNLICIVVRYFGGTKLGTGGLTRAYGNTAKKVIEASSICKFIEYAEIKLKLNYNQLQNLEYQLAKLDGAIVKKEFSENISLIVKIPEINIAALRKVVEIRPTSSY